MHKALETFVLPKNLQSLEHNKLSPIFRDAAELTAHHSLSEKIREAVRASRFLIVLCSPAAKASHWVNEEIRLFRELRGDAFILCALIDGTPQTAFPPALLEGGREPLAANLPHKREGFRLGTTQLAASMLGVGLDQLIQREVQRRKNRMRAISAASLIFAGLMGGMAWTAVDARNAAETSRSEAEKMVEFMITDLRQDLEPVGKLDILDSVGGRVTDYYDAIPLPDMDDDRLARQARARHILGQVALDQGDMDKAQSEIQTAYDATQETLRRNPDRTDAMFAHAQSAYWVGELLQRENKYKDAETYWQEYNQLGHGLHMIDPNNLDWIMEAAWGQNNLGYLAARLEHHKKSQTHYESAISIFKNALSESPENINISFELANAYAGASHAAMNANDPEAAKNYRLDQIQHYDQRLLIEPNNYNLRHRHAQAQIAYNILFEKKAQTRLKNLRRIKEELQDLTRHDPENLRWAEAYRELKEYIALNE